MSDTYICINIYIHIYRLIERYQQKKIVALKSHRSLKKNRQHFFLKNFIYNKKEFSYLIFFNSKFLKKKRLYREKNMEDINYFYFNLYPIISFSKSNLFRGFMT